MDPIWLVPPPDVSAAAETLADPVSATDPVSRVAQIVAAGATGAYAWAIEGAEAGVRIWADQVRAGLRVYAGLAVVLAFIHNRPRWFAEVMANLLFWLGPDRIIYGTDFPIWHPHWQLDDFMAFELPEDIKEEYGVDLTPEIKQKIVGGNIARLYGIDVPATLQAIKDDEFSQRRNEYLATQAPAGARGPAIDTGVAGTRSR